MNYIYEIYINNNQFTCLFFDKSIEEKNIPNIIGIYDLKYIEGSRNKIIKDNYILIQIYYKIEDLIRLKINIDEIIREENFYPLSITLSRLREIMFLKKKLFFTIDGKIIQKKEEENFQLKYAIKNDTLYIKSSNFVFSKKNDISKKDEEFQNLPNSEQKNKNKKIKKNENISTNESECNKNKADSSKINDEKEINKEEILTLQSDKKFGENNAIINNSSVAENKDSRHKDNQLDKEQEYEIFNKKNKVIKISISPDMNLNDLREKIITIIPKRSLFLQNDKTLEPSKEDLILVKEIANNNKIFMDYPIEDKHDTMEILIYLDNKIFIKKDFYISIKVKYLRNNLKIADNYKIFFKGKIISQEEEKKITLDELCYKELKIYFVKANNTGNEEILKNLSKSKEQLALEKRIYSESFKNGNFENWILIGMEKSGKTTFINYLLNYCLGLKMEDNFRYIIKDNKKNGYGIYDIKSSISKNIRLIEFPGFTSIPNEDNFIVNNIQNYIKSLKSYKDKIKIICFVMNSTQIRLTDEIKLIFSNVWKTFGNDIKNNFIFILTSCDNKDPPVLDCIRGSEFSKILPELKQPWFFKFNNSYLFDNSQKDFWLFGVSCFDKLIKDINNRENISLENTKNFIDLKRDYDSNKVKYISSLKALIEIKQYFNILHNIYSYKDTIVIPYNYSIKNIICDNCNKYLNNNYCNKCKSQGKIYTQNFKHISLSNLKNNKYNFEKCYNYYKQNYYSYYLNSADLLQKLKMLFDYQLIKNDTLIQELNDIIEQNKDNNNNLIQNEIALQESLYESFLRVKINNSNNSFGNFIKLKLDKNEL